MGAIKQSVTQGLTTVQLLYSQSAAYAAKKEEAAAKVQEKRRAAEYKKASEELDPAIESAQEELKYKQGNIEHMVDIAKPNNMQEGTEDIINFNREAEIAAEVLGGLQQAKAQAAFKAGEYGDYSSATAEARDTEYKRSGYKKEQVSAEQRYKEYVQEQNRRWKELQLQKFKKLKSQKLKYIRAQEKAKEDMALQDKKNKILLYDQYGEVIR